jgi:MFS superfamily sulfate permease-like transporter
LSGIARYISKKRYPPPLVGLAIGTAVFYALKAFGGISELGPVVGNFNFQWPKPNIFLNLSGFMTDIDIADLLPRILITGLVLGSIGSLESFIGKIPLAVIAGIIVSVGLGLFDNGIFQHLFSLQLSAGGNNFLLCPATAGTQSVSQRHASYFQLSLLSVRGCRFSSDPHNVNFRGLPVRTADRSRCPP